MDDVTHISFLPLPEPGVPPARLLVDALALDQSLTELEQAFARLLACEPLMPGAESAESADPHAPPSPAVSAKIAALVAAPTEARATLINDLNAFYRWLEMIRQFVEAAPAGSDLRHVTTYAYEGLRQFSEQIRAQALAAQSRFEAMIRQGYGALNLPLPPAFAAPSETPAETPAEKESHAGQ